MKHVALDGYFYDCFYDDFALAELIARVYHKVKLMIRLLPTRREQNDSDALIRIARIVFLKRKSTASTGQ